MSEPGPLRPVGKGARVAGADLARTTVLVVDDDDDMRALVRFHLELAEFDVVAEAVDGDDALAAFDRLGAPPVPEVVLLDNRMPGLSGLEVASRLIELVPAQRIVLFTAYADGETAHRCEEMGVRLVSKDQVGELPTIVRTLAG